MTLNETWPQSIEDPLATADPPWLKGKVAVVAGGGLSGPLGNVGFAIAWLYARSGARVAVLDRDRTAGERTVGAIRDEGGEAETFDVDVTDDASVADAVSRVLDQFGQIDVVATSIGGGGATSIFDASPEDWYKAIDVNCTSAWLLMRHVQEHMGRGGSIVTISSGAAEGRGPGMPYSIAKTALEKLTTGAASTLAPRGIRVNCVRVGMIWGAFAARGMDEEMRELRRKNVALQAEGNPWDIASAAFFLSTDQARWISGQVLAVDGGGFAMRNTGAAGSPRPGSTSRETS
ncbi:SDR family NAD(P)-dependent oxidoreductase [Phytoactinopolyspora halotolerans]|uniref:SDR family NAD(P)-dependent oxidoreductase n=1 Tax=Phytoactinopolyspora halotolerans TaxID=1981512 RepID=UPI001C20757F|nr:SDR family oxidoreductase [Phytoactinopolyspora halotolerans]